MEYNNYNQGMPLVQRQVSFQEAIERGFNNYCNFQGRASRSEYWYWALFAGLVNLVATIIDIALGTNIIASLVSLALLLPGLGLCWRRLHDIGKAGGWYFIALIPLVGIILLLVWFCKPSEMQPNRFGEVPNLV